MGFSDRTAEVELKSGRVCGPAGGSFESNGGGSEDTSVPGTPHHGAGTHYDADTDLEAGLNTFVLVFSLTSALLGNHV